MAAFERILGPSIDVLKRNIENDEKQIPPSFSGRNFLHPGTTTSCILIGQRLASVTPTSLLDQISANLIG